MDELLLVRLSSPPEFLMATLYGKRLRRARLNEGLSQDAVGQKVGVNQATVSTWETGRSKPTDAQRRKLEKMFGVIEGGRRSAAQEDEERASESATSAFGTWLRNARKDAGMSGPELAEASGVSVMAIYSLESGRSQNPQDKTKKRLEKALHATVPQDVEEEVSEEQEIRGLGQLIDFDPHDSEDRPVCGGVYVFYDISSRPIYIGKSENIAKRVKGHADKFWFKSPIVYTASYVKIPDAELRHQVEQVLIKFLKSNAVINKQSVDRDDD